MQSKNCTSSVLKNKILKTLETMTQKESMYISPKLLFEELNITEDETSSLLDSLVDDEILSRKYIFTCPNNYCQEEIIIFDSELNNYTTCEICEGEFNPQDNINLLKEICYELKVKNDSYGIDLKKYFNGSKKTNIIPLPTNKANERLSLEMSPNNENFYQSFRER